MSQLSTANFSLLPDFCAARWVFLLLLIAQLLAIILALAPHAQPQPSFWINLALISLFVHWISLMTALLLCMARHTLAGLHNVWQGFVAWCVMLVVTLVFSVLAYDIAIAIDLVGMPYLHRYEFTLRNVGISAIIGAVALRYFYVQQSIKRQIQAQAQARLEALQARIRPHFLFNALNTIVSLVHTRPAAAELAILDLSELFRAALSKRTSATLGEEIHLVKQYLHTETLRLGERLLHSWHIDANVDLTIRMPALILQPLVENAVYHGVEPLPEGGMICIMIKQDRNRLRISITNPRLVLHIQSFRPGNQLAIDNIRQRLALAYHGRALLHITHSAEQYRVLISLPVRMGAYEDHDS